MIERTHGTIFDANLADFADGHERDPLRAAPGFTRWLDEGRDYIALMERTLHRAADARTGVAFQGRNREVINMASLDYLGICQHPRVVRAQQEALEEWGSGACGVPLLSGMTTLHRELEARIAELTGNEAGVLFTSGFAGALGLCSAVLRRGDVAVLDRLAHMSWVDGVRMSGAKLATFEHNDPEDLDRVLHTHDARRRVVIVDGLYSMDGDVARLPELLDVADRHDVGLVVDEAHSIFAAGDRGGGVTERFGEQDRVRVLFGTFSKALSMVGGFVAGDRDLLEAVRFYGHPYVFSAALPPATVAGILAAIDVAEEGERLRRSLAENAAYFRDGLARLGLSTGESETWVVPVILGSDRELLFTSCRALQEAGLFVAPIDFPAVPEDAVRLRCAVSAAHTREDLDAALDLIDRHVARPFHQRRGIAGQEVTP